MSQIINLISSKISPNNSKTIFASSRIYESCKIFLEGQRENIAWRKTVTWDGEGFSNESTATRQKNIELILSYMEKAARLKFLEAGVCRGESASIRVMADAATLASLFSSQNCFTGWVCKWAVLSAMEPPRIE